MTPLAALYAPVAEPLRHMEQILRREMRSRYPYVDELVRYGCLLGGKRLRPALLLLAAQACGGVNDQHLTLAAVVEMVHTATLIHDDVLDEARVRRHLATINARWDNEASVLLGDFLFSRAFYLTSRLESTLACQILGQATSVVCEGEIRQKGSQADFSLDEASYLEILDAKTAALCACCCQLGAHFAGASETLTRHLTQYGRKLGVAFQIADDLLDVVGDESTVGKSLGSDLAKQKPTLPLIRALQTATPAERTAILAALHDDPPESVDAVRAVLRRMDVIRYARETAESFARQACEELRPLPVSPAKESLQSMASFAVRRAF